MEEQYAAYLERFLHHAWSLLASLQALDYLMLLAGLIGVAAVLVFLRADQTERRRIERDFQQRAADREFALRREVYLPAAEAIARAQDFLGKFPRMDMSRDQAQVVVDHIVGALGKAQLVASEASVQPVMAVATEFTSSYLALAARRQPLTKLAAELADLDKAIDHLAVERDHLLANLTRLAGDSAADKGGQWSDMNQRFDKLHREIGGLLGQRKDKLAQRAAAEHEFELEGAQSALRLAKLSVPAYLALRDELRLELDESQYRAMAQRSIGEIERNLSVLKQPRAERQPGRKDGSVSVRREPVIPPEPAHDTQLRVALKRGG